MFTRGARTRIVPALHVMLRGCARPLQTTRRARKVSTPTSSLYKNRGIRTR